MRGYFLIAVLFCGCAAQSNDNSVRGQDRSAASRGLFNQNWRRKFFNAPGPEATLSTNTSTSDSSGADGGREAKFLSLFTVVRFANDGCTTTNKDNGTCYSAAECTGRGGAASGSCASGFGVCCFFSFTCGQTASQNNSYFSNTNYPSSYDATGSCQLQVNKVSNDICQLRLDFFTLVLSQPETNDSTCNRDQFLVTGGSRVPSICGTNSGQHMYVETGVAGNSPITLTVVTSGTGFSRQWRIKITQLTCDSTNKADNTCLQYFTGVSGTIQSFNYDGTSGRQLSNQDYTICIRTESGFCSITYSVCTGGVFSLTGPTGGTATGAPVGAQIGAVGGVGSCVTDWLTIPCASDNGRNIQSGNVICQDRLCGDAFASTARATSNPVTSSVRPFRVVVHFDGFESTLPNPAVTGTLAQFNNRGFCLSYVQQPCTA